MSYFKIYALDGTDVRVIQIAGNHGDLVSADMISSPTTVSEEIIILAEITSANGVVIYEMSLDLATGALDEISVKTRGLGLSEQALLLSNLL